MKVELRGWNYEGGVSPYVAARLRQTKVNKTLTREQFLCVSPLFITFVKDLTKKDMQILILNGPNLNLLGVREPGIYGNSSFEDYLEKLRKQYKDITIDYFQSNVEGEMIDKMQEVGFSYDGIVLNAGAYTHTSVALHDCIRALKTPVIEVHISNVHAREEFRHHSMISSACKGVICGFGLDSYRLAIEAILKN